MGKLTERYLKEMRGEQVTISKEKEKETAAVDRFADYREALSEKYTLEVVFSGADPDGNLVCKDRNGVELVLLEEDFKKAIDYYDPSIKSKFIGRKVVVNVKEVAETEGRVYVLSARNNQRTTKSQLVGELKSDLGKGEHPHVLGKIVAVTNKSLTVDIFGRGVKGVCPVDYWSVNFTRYLKEHVKKGDVVDFEVRELMPKMKGKDTCFSLDHRPFTTDIWDNIPEEYLKVGADIIVKCIDRPEGKSFWWGTSDLIEGIEIQGDYTKKVDVMVSLPYRCKVDRVNMEKHELRVVPYELSDIDPQTANAVEFIKQTRSKGKKK